ncbi:MAG: hypothetical protein V4510_00085 [bacterium]
MDADAWLLTLAATAAGAILGGVSAWFAQHRVERFKQRSDDVRALQEKLHTLDLRMTIVETEMEVYGATGRRKTSGLDREEKHDGQG